MIENAVGTFALPMGIATNFRINGQDRLIPMVIEEPSVVAAASKGAKDARVRGGFAASADSPCSIGQIQVLDADENAESRIGESAERILSLANRQSQTLSELGRGAKSVSCRKIKTDEKEMLIVELFVDVGDAMGANITNSMCEAVSSLIEEISGGSVLLRILSNYATQRMVEASAVFARDAVGGDDTVGRIIDAYQFAKHDIYRAVTHNKGIMNGIVSVANATGQDGRAIEAAAHAYASHGGRYASLTEWSRNEAGDLVGRLKIPMAVGTVGGITKAHPMAQASLRILGAASAGDLACVLGAVGLAQNYSAMRALATDGIQKGHMALHARNLAAAAGADPSRIDDIAGAMISEGNITSARAKELAQGVK